MLLQIWIKYCSSILNMINLMNLKIIQILLKLYTGILFALTIKFKKSWKWKITMNQQKKTLLTKIYFSVSKVKT